MIAHKANAMNPMLVSLHSLLQKKTKENSISIRIENILTAMTPPFYPPLSESSGIYNHQGNTKPFFKFLDPGKGRRMVMGGVKYGKNNIMVGINVAG